MATDSGVVGHLRELFRAPHPALLEAGAGGERLVARTRLIFWVFIGMAPLSSVLIARQDTPLEVWISLGGVSAAIVLSILVIVVLRTKPRISGIGFVTAAADVTLVSLVLAAVAVAGRPSIAIHSQVAWSVYLLGIVATCLRFDVRICLFVGAVAFVEYAALLVWIYSLPAVEITGYRMLIQAARLAIIVAATAVSVGIVHRSRRLVDASGTDRLTGLASRAYFEERFAAELARSRRAGGRLALALFDIDRFKEFNDRFGHAAGDRALRRVAEVLSGLKREEDFLARWGGEELAMILPDTGLDGARDTAERIRRQLAGADLELKDATLSLTLSAGIAEYPRDGDGPNALFAVADRRLLAAKQAGRDRIVWVDDSPEKQPQSG